MRTTLSPDDDVAALFARLNSPAEAKPFHTQPVDLGNCSYPDLDNVWDVLDEAEQSGSGT
jgi:hypothetical protein